VPDPYADAIELELAVGYKSATPVRQGVANLVACCREYCDAWAALAMKLSVTGGAGCIG